MVDSPTSRNRFRKQEVGTNNNTWGINLNQVLDCIDQVTDGVETIALVSSSDYTLTTTNYTTADEAKNRVLIFTGTLSSAVNVILPSVEHEYPIVNRSGATLTPKTSAGTGVAIPNGYSANVYCDGVNVGNCSPTVFPGAIQVAGQVKSVSAGTDPTDAVNKTQMETAISTASLPATAGTVLVSGSDTTAGYLGQKVDVSANAAWSIENPAGNEKSLLTINTGAYIDGGRKTAPFTAAINTMYALCSGMTFYLPPNPTDGAKCRLALFVPTANYSIDPNGKKIGNNTSPFVTAGGQTFDLTYDNTLGDWE